MSYFQIVEFKETQEIDIVSSSWVSEDSRQCQWPPYKGIRAVQAVKNHEIPHVSWDWFDMELQQHGKTATYKEARKKLKKAENNQSLLTTDSENGSRRQAGPPSRYHSSSDEELATCSKLPAVPQFPDKAAKAAQPSNPAGTIPSSPASSFRSTPVRSTQPSPPVRTAHNPAQSLDLTPSTPSTSRTRPPATSSTALASTMNDQTTFTNIIKMLVEIKQQVRQNTLLLQKMESSVGEAAHDVEEEDFAIPLSAQDELLELEERLQNQECRRKLVLVLGTLGGATHRDAVIRILCRVFTDRFAGQLNWRGRGNKTGIGSLMLSKVICRAARKCWRDFSDSATEDVIKKWLKNSNDRSGGRKKRAQKVAAANPNQPPAYQENGDDESSASD